MSVTKRELAVEKWPRDRWFTKLRSMAMPCISGAEACRALGRIGFAHVGQKGSHVKLRNDAGRTVIVPMHRELAPGTLRSILRQAGLTVDELIALL